MLEEKVGAVRATEDAEVIQALRQLVEQMKMHGTFYDPTLSVIEGFQDVIAGNTEPIERPLVLQVGPADLIESTKTHLFPLWDALSRMAMVVQIERERLLHHGVAGAVAKRLDVIG